MVLLLAVWGHFKGNLRVRFLSAYNSCTSSSGVVKFRCLLKEDPAGYHGEGRLRGR